MKEKKFQSVVRRVVLLPMSVMAVIVCITIISCVIGFFNMQQQMVDSNLNSLQISQNQLENLLKQIDHAFIEYWNSNESYACLKNFDQETPREEYLVYESDTLTWMSNLANGYEEVEGVFVCYENIGNYLFRGTTNAAVNQYIRTKGEKGWDNCNQWHLAEIKGKQYLMNVENFRHFYGGVWIPMDTLTGSLNLNNEGYRGTIYLADSTHENSLEEEKLRGYLQERGSAEGRLTVHGTTLYNYTTSAQEDVTLGILIPQTSMFAEIPFLNKGLFLLAILSVLLVPAVALWLRRKVAMPVRVIDEAMRLIGEGNMDYRITLPDKESYDEFDRLMVRMNQTIDELNELEYKLYNPSFAINCTKIP